MAPYHGIDLSKNAAPLMKYAERIFSWPAYIEALTPSEKVAKRNVRDDLMSQPGNPEHGSSTRPYLIALHDWCTDNGFAAYTAVYVDREVVVPMEYVKNNEIVLSMSASGHQRA